MDRDTRDAAAAVLIDEVHLRDRALLDAVGARPRVGVHPAAPMDEVTHVAERIVGRIAEDLRPTSWERSDVAVHIATDDGTRLQVEALAGAEGRTWVAVRIDHLVALDDGFVDREVAELVNELNISSPGCTWVRGDTGILVVAGGAVELDRFGDRLAALYADLYASTAACAHRAAGVDHPSRSYEAAETLLADDPGGRFSLGDLLDGVRWYITRLPEPLRRLVRVDVDGGTIHLTVPLYGGEPSTLHVQTMAPGTFDGAWAASGMHLLGALPDVFDELAAADWCQRLNRAEIDGATPAGPARIGNWRWTTGIGGATTVVYHGFVPNRHRPYVAVAEVVGAAIRELWAGADQHRLWSAFTETLTAGGVDDATEV